MGDEPVSRLGKGKAPQLGIAGADAKLREGGCFDVAKALLGDAAAPAGEERAQPLRAANVRREPVGSGIINAL
jgi:hypothetical protein